MNKQTFAASNKIIKVSNQSWNAERKRKPEQCCLKMAKLKAEKSEKQNEKNGNTAIRQKFYSFRALRFFFFSFMAVIAVIRSASVHFS